MEEFEISLSDIGKYDLDEYRDEAIMIQEC